VTNISIIFVSPFQSSSNSFLLGLYFSTKFMKIFRGVLFSHGEGRGSIHVSPLWIYDGGSGTGGGLISN